MPGPRRSRRSGCSWREEPAREARASPHPAAVAVGRRSGGLAGRRVRDHGRRPGAHRALAGGHVSEDRRGGLHGERSALGDADLRDAHPVHRSRCRSRFSHAAVQHRRGGTALPRRGRCVLDRAAARRSRCHVDAALRRRHVRGGSRARRAVGAHPRRPSGLRADERDHHLADAQLRGGAAAHVPDLRQLLVLARHVDSPGPRIPAGEADAGSVRTGPRSARRSSSRSGS